MNGVLLELGFLKRLRDQLAVAAGRVNLRHVRGCADRDDGGARPARRAGGVRARASSPRDVFAPQRLWRLPLNGLHEYALPGDGRASACSTRSSSRGARGAPIERRVFATDVSDEDDGATTRTSSPTRRTRRRRRRWRRPCSPRRRSARSSCRCRSGTGSPPTAAGSGTSPSGRRSTDPDVESRRRLPLRPELPHIGVESLGRAPPPPAPLPRRPAGPRLDRRARRGGGARAARRAGPSRRHDHPADAGGDPAQHGAGGAARGERDAAVRELEALRADLVQHRERPRAAGPAQPGGTCRRGALRADRAAEDASRGSPCAASGGAETPRRRASASQPGVDGATRSGP